MSYIEKPSLAWVVSPPQNIACPTLQITRLNGFNPFFTNGSIDQCTNSNKNREIKNKSILNQAAIYLSTIALSVSILTTSTPALASDFNSLSPEQKAVAEAWRIVDSTYLDRTFNGLDWFQIRQDAIKKKYKTMADAQTEISNFMDKIDDKYTRYLPPAKYDSIVNAATGTLAGVGVEISQDGDKIFVSDVEENSPAKNAGIQPNDIFIEVDGVKFNDKSTPDDVASVLRGPKGSKVGIVLSRNDKQIDFIVTRDSITVTSVKTALSKSKIGPVGVIKIKSFSGTTASTVTNAIDKLKKDGAKAFVLDLRRNPGGLLPGGVDTASLFLEDNKPVVFVVDKRGIVDSQKTLTTGIDISSPLVLLVDKSTASAAEVLTAALKENNRAKVVGEQTFGKGIVQTIRQLTDNNGGVAVTIARYETPLHNDINKEGIKVDFNLDQACMSQSFMDVAACLPAEAFQVVANN